MDLLLVFLKGNFWNVMYVQGETFLGLVIINTYLDATFSITFLETKIKLPNFYFGSTESTLQNFFT